MIKIYFILKYAMPTMFNSFQPEMGLKLTQV